jgi:hypothetical protein
MAGTPRIRVLTIRHGLFPSIGLLNPLLKPGHWAIRLELEIEWEPQNPLRSLALLEEGLLDVCPSLRAHRCGGPAEYHVRSFAQGSPRGPDDPVPVEPALALAHLIEHVMIDAVAHVTAASAVSGITGARRESTRRFDVFVECRDPAVGALAWHLGVAWTSTLLRGEVVDRRETRILDVARSIYRSGARAFEAHRVAADAGLRTDETEDLLGALAAAGFASPTRYTMNFSGQQYYGVADPEP